MNLEGLLQDPIQLIRHLLSLKFMVLILILIFQHVIRCLLLLVMISNQGIFAELFEVAALVHSTFLKVFMAQLRLGLEGKLSCLSVLALTYPNVEEHDCDAQGGEGIIYCEVDHADLVEDLHPIFTRVVSLR